MAKGSIAVASGMQVSSGAVLGRVGFTTLRVNFCASETLIPPNLAHYLKKVASEIPCFRETSAVDIPSAYWLTVLLERATDLLFSKSALAHLSSSRSRVLQTYGWILRGQALSARIIERSKIST